jgi:putative Mn2+ efflux pump MntP
MSFLEIFLIGLGLSMDCFAVSLSLSVCGKLKWKDVLKISAFFGIFQGIMPVIGWIVGSTFQSLIQNVDHWLAFGILAFIGIRMISQIFVHETKRSGRPLFCSRYRLPQASMPWQQVLVSDLSK